MGRSRRLITASYIMSFIAAQAPNKISTDIIAKWIKVHPARVRQIVSNLVKGGLVQSQRGASGGLLLARQASEITLFDIYKAVNDGSILREGIDDPHSNWAENSSVHSTFIQLYDDLESHMHTQLAQITIDRLINDNSVAEQLARIA